MKLWKDRDAERSTIVFYFGGDIVGILNTQRCIDCIGPLGWLSFMQFAATPRVIRRLHVEYYRPIWQLNTRILGLKLFRMSTSHYCNAFSTRYIRELLKSEQQLP